MLDDILRLGFYVCHVFISLVTRNPKLVNSTYDHKRDVVLEFLLYVTKFNGVIDI